MSHISLVANAPLTLDSRVVAEMVEKRRIAEVSRANDHA